MTNTAPLHEFITTKYGQAEGYLAVWRKRGNATKAFAVDRLNEAIHYMNQTSRNDDVYVAISTQVEPLVGRKRGSAETVSSLTGLFADIDFADAKGEQTGYSKNEEEAIRILSTFPVQPTWLIGSGNGLQAHFDFERHLLLDSPEDRDSAANASTTFQRALVEHFHRHGRKIDSVGDIVRNCRPPGTFNHKSDPPKPVRLVRHDPSRVYTMQQVLELIGVDGPRDQRGKSKRSVPTAIHDKIVEGCAWYRTVVVEGAPTCPEPDWFAGASIAALCKDGESAFLAYSGKHPHFKLREAQDKFRRAVKSNAPRTCASIADDLGHRDTCEACPHWVQITSPIQLGRSGYDPGAMGPRPLGYTAEGSYVFLDQRRQILILASSSQLLTVQYLLGLANLQFWAERFPAKKEGAIVSPWDAGQVLMEECRRMGPFDPRRVRGRGVWLEGDRIIVNLGDPLPPDVRQLYLCFEPLPLRSVKTFDTARLQKMLERFVWRNP